MAAEGHDLWLLNRGNRSSETPNNVKQVIVNGDGSSLWTLTWNEDFARGFIGLLGNPKAIGETYQIMSDEQLTWNQIYQCVANALDVEFKPYYVASDFLAATSPAEWDFTVRGCTK